MPFGTLSHTFSKKKFGAPPKHTARSLFEAILYVMREGIRWSALPDKFPPRSTVHYWMQRWNEQGLFQKTMKAIVQHGEAAGTIDLIKGFIDATFLCSKNGKERVGKTKADKGHKLMAIVDRNGVPVAVNLVSATPHESKLVEKTLKQRCTAKLPKRLIGDKAYDSDALDEKMRDIGVVMIAPHRISRVNPTQDGRSLKPYNERWKVEDFNNRIQRYRKILIRYELHLKNFLGFVHIATLMMVAQKLGITDRPHT